MMARSRRPRFESRSGRSGLALAAFLLLSACGGGGTSNPATTGPGGGTGAEAEQTWTLCANQGQPCLFAGTREVRYGTAARRVAAVLTGGTPCADAVFGDPADGDAKSCWVSSRVVATDAAGSWIPCASESQFCAFSGTRPVRYGTGSKDHVGVYANGVVCSNGVFGDPVVGTAKGCSYAATALADPVEIDPAAPSGVDPPIVLNASGSVHAGDVVGLQGAGFGTAPRVYFDGEPSTPLEIVNRVGTGWLAVRVPANAPKALVLRMNNGTGTTGRIHLNRARPLHLDATRLVPGGAFRVFGRSLRSGAEFPTITIDGRRATIDPARSDEYMLTAVAPAKLATTAAAAVEVDNGNGSGPARLDRTIRVDASGGGDPFALGVGWGAGFAAIAGRTVDVAGDSRLPARVACDGTTDDSAAIRGAIDVAVRLGGAVVRLPPGRCRIAASIELKSHVVIAGAGKSLTELVYESNYPVSGARLDLTGLADLTLTNSGRSTEGMMLKDNTRLVLRNVRVVLATSRQMYLTGNTDVAIVGSDFVQTGSVADQGPYVLNNSAGLVFEGNTTQWIGGAPTFGRIHDSYLHANRFTRDARGQHAGGVVHSLTIDFAHRIAVVGNTLDVAHGPITNKARNDGETILTEGGGASRTENLGTVASATATSFSDPTNTFRLDPFNTGAIPENYGVAIVGGSGAGQTRRVVSGSGSTLTVDRAWDIVPDATSRYATFVWGLEKSLIKDNVLSQNPRGIWLYQTAVRDVDVVGNRMTEGGGIYLRAFQNLSERMFMPLYNVVIANNRIVNAGGHWMSYVNATFTNTDARAFGIAMLGIEMRSNEVVANRPNRTSTVEDYAGQEGFFNLMRVENHVDYETSPMPRLLGAILDANTCAGCDVAVRIGTGAGGTTILNTRRVASPIVVDDAAYAASPEKSTDTVVR